MKGFDVTSEYDMGTDDGSMQWNITLENTSGNYIEFGDVGLPMPWNSAYSTIDDTYNNRVTVHTYAGADSGYAYAIRCAVRETICFYTGHINRCKDRVYRQLDRFCKWCRRYTFR